MAQVDHVGDLAISQDLDFQQRSWTVQRVGWLVMALLLVAAIAGLFGGGPLSQAAVGEEGAPLQVEYPRFGRVKAPTELRLRLGPGAASGDEARIWLDGTMLQAVQIRGITPEADRVEAGPDRLT